MTIANQSGQQFRFVHEMKEGDYVIYPSQRDHLVHIGKIDGGYRYDPSLTEHFQNLRKVKWLKAFPRAHFTQGALYEIGSAMALFQVKSFANEFLAALEGKAAPPTEPPDVPALQINADRIEQFTSDHILKRISQDLKGHPFADLVAHLLNIMGYRTRVSPEGPDGGVDILAHRDELGFEPPIIKVQVKSSLDRIGDPIVTALYGKVGASEHGLFVTLGTFSSQAVNFAKSKTNLRLIDGQELVDLIIAHYDNFDSRYKGLIPLKRVYVPETLPEEEE
jgi:restriction system protein